MTISRSTGTCLNSAPAAAWGDRFMSGMVGMYKEEMLKALTTGSGIVAGRIDRRSGATRAVHLPERFSFDWVSCTNKDAVAMSLIPRGKPTRRLLIHDHGQLWYGRRRVVGETGSRCGVRRRLRRRHYRRPDRDCQVPGRGATGQRCRLRGAQPQRPDDGVETRLYSGALGAKRTWRCITATRS